MEYFVYLFEIDGRVRLGISHDPHTELRSLETALGVRAVRVFKVPLNKARQQTVQRLLKRNAKYPAAYIAHSYSLARAEIAESA